MKWGIILLLFGLSHGFLLDSGNSSIPAKTTFVTVSEYYDGQSKTQDKLNKIQQDIIDNQEEQKKTLNFLASQLQTKLEAYDQEMAAKTSLDSNQEAYITKLEQEITKLKTDSDNCQQRYQTLAADFDHIEQINTQLQQEVNILKTGNQFLKNDSTDLHKKVDDLMRLKSIDQLQTMNKLQQETQNLDLKYTSLARTEQARDQAITVLFNKISTLETNDKLIKENVKSDLTLLQNNMTSLLHYNQIKQDLALETLENKTNVEMGRLMEYNNASLANLEERIDNESKPVVFTACHLSEENDYSGIIKFSTIKTSVGVPDLSSFNSTGMFTCHDPGYYYVMTTIEAAENNAVLQIMVNSTAQLRQYVTGYTKDTGYWTPGTSALTLKLETNDQVWIAMVTSRHINRACLNIFKISS